MKRQKLTTLTLGALVGALVLFLASCSEEEFNPSLTREFSIQSTFNGATYKIKVGLPLDYNSSGIKHSSIYVLDGEENFDFVANHCEEISDRYSVTNVVVVGIGYGNDRELDYTPTKISPTTGGGGDFLRFLENELVPRIEQEFSVDTTRNSRAILGHSYGGLFVACALAVNNQLFGNYILLSPSIWFDNEVSLLLEKEYRERNRDKPQLVFLGIGQSENLGRMQAPFEAFYQTLRDNYSSISLSKNREDDLDHMGSKNPNIIKGLTYYFKNR
ncbi:MAG: alpha/beta hydrolase-fold protein [Imperialibacter sp.]|uniref:alpha/beta hydrolase n=1 Tax=Imperialibacter sp. TaxID=2038411 RepID=UPI0032EAB9BA